MPVTFTVASHPARQLSPQYPPKDVEALLQRGAPSCGKNLAELIQSSVKPGDLNTQDGTFGPTCVLPRSNGLVHTCVDAYNKHLHLTIRPDDLWIAVLSQFSHYVNGHAEEMRSYFVEHEGKKEIKLKAGGSRATFDFRIFIKGFAVALDENILDKELKDWIIPNFSTTKETDQITSMVLMMATLKAYFDYDMCLMCGIPSVTLLGEKEDYEAILSRVQKLSRFGVNDLEKWQKLLEPVIEGFVASFDTAETEKNRDWWQRICHRESMGSGPTYLCGWITAFCPFDDEGKWILTSDSEIDISMVAPGWAEVDVHLDDNGAEFETMMVAGLLAQRVSSSGLPTTLCGEEKTVQAGSERVLDTLSPYTAWFLFIKNDASKNK